jgi:hypothetical protein
MLSRGQDRTLGGLSGFRKVMGRMHGNTESKGAQCKHKADRRGPRPLPQAMGHGDDHQHEDYDD